MSVFLTLLVIELTFVACTAVLVYMFPKVWPRVDLPDNLLIVSDLDALSTRGSMMLMRTDAWHCDWFQFFDDEPLKGLSVVDWDYWLLWSVVVIVFVATTEIDWVA
jgi:hypothetical protein